MSIVIQPRFQAVLRDSLELLSKHITKRLFVLLPKRYPKRNSSQMLFLLDRSVLRESFEVLSKHLTNRLFALLFKSYPKRNSSQMLFRIDHSIVSLFHSQTG